MYASMPALSWSKTGRPKICAAALESGIASSTEAFVTKLPSRPGYPQQGSGVACTEGAAGPKPERADRVHLWGHFSAIGIFRSVHCTTTETTLINLC